jgi:hypothetical protein
MSRLRAAFGLRIAQPAAAPTLSSARALVDSKSSGA